MNRLVIIGNGFDMAHGLKTSYTDFINWYWDQRIAAFSGNLTNISEDCLCKLKIKDETLFSCWNVFAYSNSNFFKDIFRQSKYTGSEVIQYIKENSNLFSVEYSPFFRTILLSIESKGWVDIENDYYQLLKNKVNNSNCDYSIDDLNEQLDFLREKLVEYLHTIKIGHLRSDLLDVIIDSFDPADFSTEGKMKALDNIGIDVSFCTSGVISHSLRNKLIPERIMLLSFNYTDTPQLYQNFNIVHNYIHGKLDNPESIIFGYGDELDKTYQHILDMNDNRLLKNIKSFKYLVARHYRDLLEFIGTAPFQVFIMGHSCGNSDRTLLNTVFEHDNCVSIKPFYYQRGDGSDNYYELIQNISRNFTNMKLFRDRIVSKEQCKTM